MSCSQEPSSASEKLGPSRFDGGDQLPMRPVTGEEQAPQPAAAPPVNNVAAAYHALGLGAYADDEKKNAWSNVAQTVQEYSDDLIEQWIKQLDDIPTFAGLFSAVLTAFNVESYLLLQPDANVQTNAILTSISVQLESFRVNAPFINSTGTAFNVTAPPPPFKVPVYAVWLNSLWFTSLVFGLASGIIGIIAKQWLRQYKNGLHGSSRNIARRRQYRYDNLRKWHVGTIVTMTPIILLIAAILFLAGLLILLFSINNAVAEVVSVFVGLLFLFVTTTTILPTVYRSCCYYSPQAHAFFSLRNFCFLPMRRVLLLAIGGTRHFFGWVNNHISWSPLQNCYDFLGRQLEHSGQWRWSRIWLGSDASFGELEAKHLDMNILITAYYATLDAATIDTSIAACVSDGAGCQFWMDYILKLRKTAIEQSGARRRLPRPVHPLFMMAAQCMIQSSDIDSHPLLGPILKDTTLSTDEPASGRYNSEIGQFLRDIIYWRDDLGDTCNQNDGLQIRMYAQLSSMFWKMDIKRTNQAWDMVLCSSHSSGSWDLVTCKIVTAAIVCRLNSFDKSPRLDSDPSRLQRHVELRNVILPPLRVIGQLLANHTVSKALGGIVPLVTAALDLVQTLLAGMDHWNSVKRNWVEEVYFFRHILEEIQKIHVNEKNRDQINPRLIEALAETRRAVFQANKNSLHVTFIKNTLGSAHQSQRHIELENVILPPLHTIRELLVSSAASKGPLSIEPLVTDTLEFVQTFLNGMDWDSSERNLEGELHWFMCILEEIQKIYVNEKNRDQINPRLIEALAETRLAVFEVNRISLHAFIKNPHLGSPHQPQRHIEWELKNVILPPLHTISELLVNGTASNMPWIIVESATVNLDFVRMFLEGMDWESSKRNLEGELHWFRCILEEIQKIYGKEQARDSLMTPNFVKNWMSVFSRIIGKDDWEHTTRTDFDERKKCEDLLVELRSTPGILNSS